jgi:hypothetical protein
MTPPHHPPSRFDKAPASACAASGRSGAGPFGRWWVRAAGGALLLALLAACGGSNPLDNPPDISNGGGVEGDKLSFAYFQKCVDPIVTTNVDPNKNCSNANCHAPGGSGGAFRAITAATPISLVPPIDATAARATDMYKNYRSAAGQTLIDAPGDSRLLNKPLLNGTLHSGGQIFANDQVTEARTIRFWISNPIPPGQDEFSAANYSILFSNGNPVTGTCNF